jgi:hypothetical protein
MKRLLVALALLAAPSVVRAQACTGSGAGCQAQINTTLRVTSAVSLSAGSNLDFGIVAGGTAGAVDAQGTSASGGTPGSVVLVANQAVGISASFSSLAAAGLPSLTVASTSCGVSASSTPSASTTVYACSGAGSYTSPVTGTGAGGLYVWLGGSVSTTASTPAGNYAGTATVTGTYTVY